MAVVNRGPSAAYCASSGLLLASLALFSLSLAGACVVEGYNPDEDDSSLYTGDSLGGDPAVVGDDGLPGDDSAASDDPGLQVDDGTDPEPLRSGPFLVLFDNSKGEQASNADWVIDDTWPSPSPASPSSAEAWQGAYSSFGYDLWHTGRYQVKTLPPDHTITYGQTSSEHDLTKFDLFVVPEPNNQFSAAEKTAILDFVENGGGLFIIAGHGGADRDGDGWDACHAWNDLMTANGVVYNPFGFSFNCNSFTEEPITNIADMPENRVLHGPFGDVTAIGIQAGSGMTIQRVANPLVRGLIWRNGYVQGDRYVDFLTSKYGDGRIAAIGDSSAADDGTANPGNTDIYDSWSKAGLTNDILFLNASAWLVRDIGY